MTATDELRKMLNELGVEYNTHGERYGTWYDTPLGGRVYVAENNAGYLHVKSDAMTPEQAIAATLGAGTCHLEDIEMDCETASEYMLDREWCFDAVYRCSCGYRFGYVAHNRPRYCPNCGAKVVDAEVDE